jgi:hypothetical protein
MEHDNEAESLPMAPSLGLKFERSGPMSQSQSRPMLLILPFESELR